MSQAVISAGLADIPIAESAVSFIDGRRARLEYRGVAVETLARESCFEETSWLLLRGELPTQRELADFEDQLRHHRRLKYKLKDLIRCLPETGHPMDALQASVAAMGMFYPARDITNAQTNWDSCVRLIAKMPTVVAAFHRLRAGDKAIDPRDDLDHAANFYWMLFEREPSPAIRKVLDACLILHAEHTMNASTFSARVTGSTLADPYTVISSAIGTLTGPLHGGANEEVLVMLDKIGSKANVPAYIKSVKEGHGKLMGFGHRVYKNYDPRAKIIKRIADEVFEVTGRNAKLDIALELERIALEDDYFIKRKLYPNVDFYSGIIYQAIGFAPEAFTVMFAIPRTVGWLAQWQEMVEDAEQKIARPRQVYMGEMLREFVPIDERGVKRAEPVLAVR